MDEKLNIFEKINEVRKSVDYLEKDKQVGGKYWAVTHDSVTAAVRNSLIAQGIILVPTLISSQSVPTTVTTGKGIPYIRYEAKYSIAFVNMEEPTERVEVVVESHAMDEGDKAPGKAISYATKYAMLKLFSIESGDHEEDRPEVKVAKEKAFEKPHKPTDGAWEALSVDERTMVFDLSNRVRSLATKNDIKGACDEVDESLEGCENHNDLRIALFDKLADVSAVRGAMKKEWAERRAARQPVEA